MPRSALSFPGFLQVGFLYATLIALLLDWERPHDPNVTPREQALMLGRTVLWASLLLGAAAGFSTPAVAALSTVSALQIGAMLAWRRYQHQRFRRRLSSKSGARNVLIAGACSLGRKIADYLEQHPETDRTFCGFLDDWKPAGDGVIGRTRDLAKLARSCFIDEVILASAYDRERVLLILREAQRLHLDVKIAPELFGCAPAPQTERIGDVLLVSLHEECPPFLGLMLKRALDMTGSALALVCLTPAWAVIALSIKLDSPGPILYAAPRAGRKGRPFRCYKFRTMVKDADLLKEKLRERNQRRGAFFKITDDPRITRVGRFLRRYSLDELPQLWNVLIGDMSLVGPRPHPLDDFSAYAIEHLPRLDVTPGMTGLWQVTARRDPSFQTGVDLDLDYIRHWSLGMDMRILLKTAGAVFRGSGD